MSVPGPCDREDVRRRKGLRWGKLAGERLLLDGSPGGVCRNI